MFEKICNVIFQLKKKVVHQITVEDKSMMLYLNNLYGIKSIKMFTL